MNQTNNQMQVLMYGWELPPENSGGLGVACYGIAKGLSHHGVGVSFALPRKVSTNAPFMKLVNPHIPGVSFTAINSLIRAYQTPTQYQYLTQFLPAKQRKIYGNSLYDEAHRFADIASHWSHTEPHSIIHTHDWMTFPAGINTSRKTGKPFVAHIHATEYDRTGGQINEKIAQIEYEGLNKADKVIAVSHYTKQAIQDRYSVPGNKIEVVHNGVDFVEFNSGDVRRVFPNDKIVLFVGRLTYQKGIDFFLKAAVQVLQHQPDTVFVIAGVGDMRQQLMLQAAELGIGQRVVFAGFQSGNNLRSLYRMADVFVMPSISEPYGIVALEAIASGTPTIISKQSGVSETIHNTHTVDFWDVNKMSQLITYTLQYPQLAKEMSRLAQHEARSLTWNNAAQKIIQVYQGLH